MRKTILTVLAICACAISFAGTNHSQAEKTKFVVTALGESYLGSDNNPKIDSWQATNSTSSTVVIDWDKKVIEITENGQMMEGPFKILSVGKEYLNADKQPSVRLLVDEGYGFDDMAVEFVITATEGKDVKSMVKGYLYQIYDTDVFGYKLSR